MLYSSIESPNFFCCGDAGVKELAVEPGVREVGLAVVGVGLIYCVVTS